MIDVSQIMNKVNDVVRTRLDEMAARWEGAIHAQHMDARLAGRVQVANALLETKVKVVRKSDTEASLEVECPGLQLDELKDDLSFYILQPGKTYAFGG